MIIQRLASCTATVASLYEASAEYLIRENRVGTLVWEVRVVRWDVSYGAEFVPSIVGGYTLIVQKARKIGTQETSLFWKNTYVHYLLCVCLCRQNFDSVLEAL
ncbi:hypothetical protein CASFOL_003766 [Castilleja foliolosa]|uniref:Patellin-1-6 C-terminal GOLD domain-containing protein n=1 Tax=Castilleja foliolosa TaxID=1961234 RepID=A0ABD3ELW6_9LAMI